MRALAPPPDLSLEASLPVGLRRTLDAYIALERRVQEVASGSCAPVCAACRNPCCKAAFCSEAWDTPWLLAATSRPGARREVAPEQAIEGHLARAGCRLRFGRPPVCYEFACADVVSVFRTDDEKYLCRVISHVITFAGEEALPGTHLVEVMDLARLDRRRVACLRRRIALAGLIFDAAFRLFRARGRGDERDWALVTEHFSPRGYRLARGAAAPVTPAPGRLRTLPIVPAVLATATLSLAIVLGGAGCTSALRLDLLPCEPARAAPPVAAPNEYRDAECLLRFDARTDGLGVLFRDLTAGRTLVIAWDRAFHVDPHGQRHAAIGYEHPVACLLRQDPAPPLVVAPGEAWIGRVRPRDRIPPPTGPRFFEDPLLSDVEAVPGTVVGLDLPVDGGLRPAYHELRFRLAKRQAPGS